MRGLIIVSGAWNQRLDLNPETHDRKMGTVTFRGFSIAPCDSLSFNNRYLTPDPEKNVRFAFTTNKICVTTSLLEVAPEHQLVIHVFPALNVRPANEILEFKCFHQGDVRSSNSYASVDYLDLEVTFNELPSPGINLDSHLDLVSEVIEELQALRNIYEDATQTLGEYPIDHIRFLEIPVEES